MSAPVWDKLCGLKIAAFCEPGSGTDTLVRHLQRSRADIRNYWPPPERLNAQADLVIRDYAAGLAMTLPWPPGEAEAALIVVLPANGRYSLSELQGACPDAVLHQPATTHAIDTVVMLALDHFEYTRRLRARIGRLEENVRAIRTIEKAKQMLMAHHKVDEERAFRMLRGMAMQKRVSIASLAGRLVDSADLLTYKN